MLGHKDSAVITFFSRKAQVVIAASYVMTSQGFLNLEQQMKFHLIYSQQENILVFKNPESRQQKFWDRS